MKEYKVICPLIGFQIPNVLYGIMSKEEVKSLLKKRKKELVEGIDLFDGVKVRRISKEDFEDLKSSIFPLPPGTKVYPGMFVLEKYITTDGHDFQLEQTMRNIILAMRLLKEGYVSGNCIFYVLVSEKLEGFVSVEWSWWGGRRLEPGEGYVLYFGEIPALRKMLERVQEIDFATEKRLYIACKRFQLAYEEVDFEDRLIDFMIAFEALFVKKETEGKSKKEKVANGCSDILGKDKEEKEEIRSFLVKAHKIRDLIVHGAEYKIEEGHELFKVVPRTEEYLRRSIREKL